MFGYVKTWQPELKMGEFELYRGIYCSLCKQLGKRYGLLSRMTLSYDFTFLALFRMALDERCAGFHKSRCSFNPLKKRTCCSDSPHIAETADAATLFVYYKLRDTLADDGFFHSLPARLLLPFAARAHRKAARRQPELDTVIAQCIARQTALEKAQTASIDAAAEPSAQMLAYLAQMTAQDETQRRVLDRFGYCLGRWIYLVDAVDDLPEDLRVGHYNPYIVSRGLTPEEPAAVREVQEYSLLTLNACLAECMAAYNLLTIHRFDGILRNILELGMPAVQKQVIQEKQARKKKGV